MDDQDDKRFEQWWESVGKSVEAGGGDYQHTFAYRAYEAAVAFTQGELKRVTPLFIDLCLSPSDLQTRLASYVEEAFAEWWQAHGQYCRSGGGPKEKTFARFAYHAGLGAARADVMYAAANRDEAAMSAAEHAARRLRESARRLARKAATKAQLHESFQEWARTQFPENKLTLTRSTPEFEYRWNNVQVAWEMWQTLWQLHTESRDEAVPVARAHISLEDDGLHAELEVLNGDRMQVADSPVDLFLVPLDSDAISLLRKIRQDDYLSDTLRGRIDLLLRGNRLRLDEDAAS